MIKKNQNGFTLILSLVLLLVMSLMGGSLIVIASGDHQSNNTSDQYQQTFYVAEHALIEAQKHLVNRMKGPWVTNQDLENCGTEGEDCNIGNYNQSLPDDISEEEKDKAEAEHENYLNQLLEQTAPELDGDGNVISNANGAARNIDQRDIPSNIVTPTKTPCYKSFKNLLRKTKDSDGDEIDQKVTNHFINQGFGDVISPIISLTGLPALEQDKEKEYLNRFRFEYFAINAGSKTFKGAGQSIKKTSTNVQRRGTAYKIYGCGYLMPKGDAGYEDPEILIPLESVVVLST